MQLHDQTNFEPDRELLPNDKKPLKTRRFPEWTGFNDKTLWDVLQFLCTAAVPIVLTVWSIQQNQTARQQEEQNQKQNEDNQRSKILSDYLDSMTKYLLEDSVKEPTSGKANMIARARTLNTLRQLDADRKGQLLKFLYEANLVVPCQPNAANCNVKLGLKGARLDEVKFDKPIPMQRIELSEASLPAAELPGIDLTRAQLQKANLEKANLKDATLTKAQLDSAVLRGAKVTDAFLEGATMPNALMTNADLRGSRFTNSSLKGADLANANLDNADLTGADLRDVNFTGATLSATTILKNARYNQKTKFPENFNPDGKGLIRQD
jgi:uncharacterized protein YjbI with pentapeptide repeats